jgi:hypothetical protein
LIEAIGLALDARRPRLAARLVALVGTEAEDDGGMLDRARKAAELVLVAAEPEGEDWPELRMSFTALRRRRDRRPTSRLRRTLFIDSGDDEGPFPRRRR